MIANAIKFTCKGSVVIKVSDSNFTNLNEGNKIRVDIKDTGCGIDETK